MTRPVSFFSRYDFQHVDNDDQDHDHDGHDHDDDDDGDDDSVGDIVRDLPARDGKCSQLPTQTMLMLIQHCLM